MTHQAPIPRSTPLSAYFTITMRLADSSDDLLVRHVRLLRDCVAVAQSRWSFDIEAAVVLPNRFDLMCKLSDAQYGMHGAVQMIASAFNRHVPDNFAPVWAEEFNIIEISPAAVPLRRSFIEHAPVRAGLVKRPADWPFSSAHQGVALASEMGVAVA